MSFTAMTAQPSLSRRRFIQRGVQTAVGIAASVPALRLTAAESSPLFTALGVASRVNRAGELKALGAQYLVESVGGLLVPDQPESDFAPRLAAAVKAALPVRGCNGFIRPPHLKCTGPEANHEAVLEWAEIVFRRAQQAGVEYIVFGSAGARRLPEGWPVEKADEQFTELLRRMGPLAQARDVTVAVEPLQQRECNYLMRLSEVVKVVRSAGQSRIRAVADLYHMSSMEEGPEIIAEAAPLLHCIEIAEREGRTPPGVAGQDFRPYFSALSQAGFSGPITIEGRWTPEQLKAGFLEIRRQAAETD